MKALHKAEEQFKGKLRDEEIRLEKLKIDREKDRQELIQLKSASVSAGNDLKTVFQFND